MSLWGTTDAANNAPAWAAAQFNLTPNTDNRDALFGNTTSNTVGTNETIGIYGVSSAEVHNTGANGTVYGVTVTAPGTGYTALATVAFANGGVDDGDPTTNATGTATMRLISVTVSHGGNNYVPGNHLSPSDGTAITPAIINVTSTELRSATVNDGGTGYANADVITISTGTGTAANATVTTDGDGIVTSVSLVNNGVYTVNPTLTGVATVNSTGIGTGLTLDLVTKLFTIAIAEPGEYSAIPTLSANPVSNVTGTGVSANVNLVIGVANVTLTNSGVGYVTAPDVTFGGAGGSGSTATAYIYTSESSSAGRQVAHSGWVVKKTGSGGRAGRIQYETLVAGGISSDASDDAAFPE